MTFFSIGRSLPVSAGGAWLCLLALAAGSSAQISAVRTERTSAAFVPLQSYVMGETEGDLLFFGGLSAMGFHSLARDGRATFPHEAFNRYVHLHDPDSGTTRSATISTLPHPLRQYLVTTNAQAVQIDEKLYIYGGYGPETRTPSWATWDTVVEIDLPAVRRAILNSFDLPFEAFAIHRSPAARVAGGSIVRYGSYFALVGGSNFTGNYGEEVSFRNEYSEAVHIFDPSQSMTEPQRSYYDPQYHRRDGNVSLITLGLAGNQRPGFIVHIGVFKPGREVLPEVWEHPIIYDTQSGEMSLKTNFTQMMNQYEAPRASFHSARRGENYLITLGGLSGANWDGHGFVHNITIPWVRDVTMLTLRDSDVISETVVGAALKPVTNAELVLNTYLPRNSLGQINWDDLVAGEILLGHFYGGIEAANPGNSAVTRASDTVYAVYATIDKFRLEATPLRAGEEATLSVIRAAPGSTVYFAYSTAGGGPTYLPPLGLSVDLSRPIIVLGEAEADAQGLAEITFTVPPGAPETDVWIQAVNRESPGLYVKSNQVRSRIER